MRSAICVFLLLGAVPAAHGDDARCTALAPLSWLLGSWRAETPTRIVTETWRRVSANTFEGEGRTEKRDGGATVSAETLRLVQMLDQVFFIAMVEGNPLPVAFRLDACTAHFARFNNPAHDFPRRLDYRLLPSAADEAQAADVLMVDVSDGGEDGFSLRFERVAAAAPHDDGDATHDGDGVPQ